MKITIDIPEKKVNEIMGCYDIDEMKADVVKDAVKDVVSNIIDRFLNAEYFDPKLFD
jgi:hypothetical protein